MINRHRHGEARRLQKLPKRFAGGIGSNASMFSDELTITSAPAPFRSPGACCRTSSPRRRSTFHSSLPVRLSSAKRKDDP